MRIAYLGLLWLIVAVTIGGCQLQPQVSRAVETYKILQSPKNETNTFYLACAAAQGCDFSRVDQTIIIDGITKRPTSDAIEKGLIRLEGSLLSLQQSYALSLIAGQKEVVMEFYPITKDRAERFHLIHHFKAGHRYKLMMYRQRSVQGGSLLNVAMPGPLCVDLLQDEIPLRRFCRPFDSLTGLGEFLEQKI